MQVFARFLIHCQVYPTSLGIKRVVNDWLAAFFADIVGLKGYQFDAACNDHPHLIERGGRNASIGLKPQVTMCQ